MDIDDASVEAGDNSTPRRRGRPRRGDPASPADAATPTPSKRRMLSRRDAGDDSPEYLDFTPDCTVIADGSLASHVRVLLHSIAPHFQLTLQTRESGGEDGGKTEQRLVCPIPGCSKTFLNIDGIIYHGKTTVHSVLDALEWAHPADALAAFTPDADLPLPVRAVWRVTAFEKQTRDIPFIIGFPKKKGEKRVKTEPIDTDAVASGRSNAAIPDSVPLAVRTLVQQAAAAAEPSEIPFPLWRSTHGDITICQAPPIDTAGKSSVILAHPDEGIAPYSLNILQGRSVSPTESVLFCGPDLRAISFCPSSPSSPHHFLATTSSSQGTIQIWNIGALDNDKNEEKAPFLAMSLVHNEGVCHDIAWLPICAQDNSECEGNELKRLGILAAVFGSGEVSVFAVPEPEGVSKAVGNDPPCIRLTPMRSLHFPSSPLCLSWLPSPSGAHLTLGTSTGDLCVLFFPFSSHPFSSSLSLEVVRFFPAHFGAIRAASLCPQNPLCAVSCGEDGAVHAWDLNDPAAPLAQNSSRSIAASCGWTSSEPRAYFCTEGNAVKLFWLQDRFKEYASVRVIEHGATAWAAEASPCTGIVASGGADGTVLVIPNYARIQTGRRKIKPWRVFRVISRQKVQQNGQEMPQNGQEMQQNGQLTHEYVLETSKKAEEWNAHAAGGLPRSEEGVIKVTWCPTGGKAGWMAAATGGGTVHVFSVHDMKK